MKLVELHNRHNDRISTPVDKILYVKEQSQSTLTEVCLLNGVVIEVTESYYDILKVLVSEVR